MKSPLIQKQVLSWLDCELDHQTPIDYKIGCPEDLVFDPRPGQQETVTMICVIGVVIRHDDTSPRGHYRVMEMLARYNLKTKTFISIYEKQMNDTIMLQHLCNGAQIALMHFHNDYNLPIKQRYVVEITIFDTDTLTPLCSLPGLTNVYIKSISVIPFYSVDQTQLAVAVLRNVVRQTGQNQQGMLSEMWKSRFYDVKKGTKHRDMCNTVVVCRNPLRRKIQGLKALCRRVILDATKRSTCLDTLPLPRTLIGYLEGNECMSDKR